MDAVCRDWRTAPIAPKEKALFGYLERLTLEPASLRQEDADAVLAAGWGEDEVFDAVTTCALFGFFNRWIDGNGVPDTPPGFYTARIAQMGDFRYA